MTKMKYSDILKLFVLLMLGCVVFGSSARTKQYQSMAMYIAAEDVEAIQPPQERAAARLFKERFAQFGDILTPSQVDKIKYPDYDCLWINIDSVGKSQGVEKFRQAFISPAFISAVRKFHEDGGNLYMSKFAIELLFSDGIGALPDYIRPNVFSSGEGGENADIWSVNAEIGAILKDGEDVSRYADHRSHPVYAGLTTLPSNRWAANPDPIYDSHIYQVYPMQGKADFSTLHREDHNCMWRLAMKTDENAKIGIYIGYEGVHDYAEIDKVDNPQERAALDYLLNPDGYFKRVRPGVNVEVICPGDIERIDPNNFDCIWVHIDRCGLNPGWENLPEPFRRDDLIAALRDYSKNGGQLLLTKQATQLAVAIGRIDSRFAPGVFSAGDGGEGFDDWEVNAHIGWDWRDSDPAQYFDRTGYKIYDGLTVSQRDGHDVFPLIGTADPSTSLWREDHNCLWNLASVGTLSGNRIVAFQNEVNARVLGTWGQTTNDEIAGIVEFRPTIQYRGRIIANGLAAYELAPRSGVNAYSSNIDLLTFNCLRYLVTVTDFSFVSDGPDGVSRFEQDANATVLGTWGQDWNHQAAGIVEFHPAAVEGTALHDQTYSDELAELNKDKAPRGTIVANGLGCVQLYHPAGDNEYQDNTDRLTANIIDYLSPWHISYVSGVEELTGGTAGEIYACGGNICWNGFDVPVVMEVYTTDGRQLISRTVSGEGSVEAGLQGIVLVRTGDTVRKLRID